MGIDRMDPTLEYTVLENCRPCCWNCNRMKHKLNLATFTQHIVRIVDHITKSGYIPKDFGYHDFFAGGSILKPVALVDNSGIVAVFRGKNKPIKNLGRYIKFWEDVKPDNREVKLVSITPRQFREHFYNQQKSFVEYFLAVRKIRN